MSKETVASLTQKVRANDKIAQDRIAELKSIIDEQAADIDNLTRNQVKLYELLKQHNIAKPTTRKPAKGFKTSTENDPNCPQCGQPKKDHKHPCSYYLKNAS